MASSLPTLSRQSATTLLDEFNRTVLDNPWIPYAPHPRQRLFLIYPALELLYGGAAGGGKTAAQLMAAAQYVDVPGYAALILRRTYPQLESPRSLIPLSLEWWSGTGAKYNEQRHRWTFPSGATISFGHLQNERDKYNYQSAAFQYIGFDELTQFTQSMYTYLFSRLRKPVDMPVPLRQRASSNPGGVGHAWVRRRFIEPHGDKTRAYIPARLEDNPSLDRESYEEALAKLAGGDATIYAQLRHGDWDVVDLRGVFCAEALLKMRKTLEPGQTGQVLWVAA